MFLRLSVGGVNGRMPFDYVAMQTHTMRVCGKFDVKHIFLFVYISALNVSRGIPREP